MFNYFMFYWLNVTVFYVGEELSKKQAAQESTIRKLRAQVCTWILQSRPSKNESHF